jgi:hypothetical protein
MLRGYITTASPWETGYDTLTKRSIILLKIPIQQELLLVIGDSILNGYYYSKNGGEHSLIFI